MSAFKTSLKLLGLLAGRTGVLLTLRFLDILRLSIAKRANLVGKFRIANLEHYPGLFQRVLLVKLFRIFRHWIALASALDHELFMRTNAGDRSPKIGNDLLPINGHSPRSSFWSFFPAQFQTNDFRELLC